METKVCTKCGQEKDVNCFAFRKDTGRHRTICKECDFLQYKDYAERNKEKLSKSRKLYYSLHKKEISDRAIAWNRSHPEKVKEFREKCRDVVRESRRKYFAEKRKNDPCWKMKRSLRSRMGLAMDRYGNGKNGKKTIDYLGCSVDEFMKHIEAQFKEGMTWENHGNGNGFWNLDHILPCNSFDLTKEDEQRKCFNFKNIRPLWWSENIKKSDKMPDGTKARDLKKAI